MATAQPRWTLPISMSTFLRPHRRAACAAIIPLAVVVCACGAGKHRSQSTSAQRDAVPAAAATGTRPDNMVAARREAAAASHATSGQVPKIPAGKVLRTLRGRGNAGIGSLSERVPVVVDWRSTHAIQLFTDRGFLLLSSQSPHGRIRLAAGRYRGLRIATAGRWRIALRSSR